MKFTPIFFLSATRHNVYKMSLPNNNSVIIVNAIYITTTSPSCCNNEPNDVKLLQRIYQNRHLLKLCRNTFLFISQALPQTDILQFCNKRNTAAILENINSTYSSVANDKYFFSPFKIPHQTSTSWCGHYGGKCCGDSNPFLPGKN